MVRPRSALKRELASLTLPILVETLLIMTLGAVDTFMLSRHSDASVAAVGLANQLIAFTFIIFEVINLGTSVLCSQYLGAGLRKRMESVIGVSLVVNLLFGLFVSSVLCVYSDEILSALGLEGEMLREGNGYMEIVGAFAFFQALQLTLSAVLRSNNKAVYPMLVILVVNCLNIFGNYALIFGKFGVPALGVNGAAISTSVCRMIAMVTLAVIVFRTTISRFPTHIFRKWPGEEFRNLMKIGLPSAGEQFSYNCSQLVIAYFITSLGMESLASRTYCVNIVMYVYLFSIAVSHAGAICVGHLVGAGRWQGAYLMGKYVMRVALVWTLLFSLLIALAGPQIMSGLTDNPQIISLCVAILWIDVVLEIGRPLNILFVNVLQAAGDVNYPFYVGLVWMWSIAVVCAYLFGVTFGFGILGMWWMFALDENVRGVVFIRRWESRKWQNKAFVA
ncbi:MAG: MATE family efflux transporter [Candidatus Amulumruptor caecigallinarius]|nr:MATE family efflux transporter [Candidatus Amulumruptor caecigallinarius]